MKGPERADSVAFPRCVVPWRAGARRKRARRRRRWRTRSRRSSRRSPRETRPGYLVFQDLSIIGRGRHASLRLQREPTEVHTFHAATHAPSPPVGCLSLGVWASLPRGSGFPRREVRAHLALRGREELRLLRDPREVHGRARAERETPTRLDAPHAGFVCVACSIDTSNQFSSVCSGVAQFGWHVENVDSPDRSWLEPSLTAGLATATSTSARWAASSSRLRPALQPESTKFRERVGTPPTQ